MTNEERISAIRAIYHDNKSYDWSDDFLLQHGCLHLLSDSDKRQLGQLLNKTVTNIRFSACADAFRKLENIPYAVIKGAVLAQHAYGDSAMRISSDIDLLTSKSAFPQVKTVLISEGFVQGTVQEGEIVPYTRAEIVYHLTQTHQAATFVKPTGNGVSPYIVVDVNMDIFWGESGISVNMDEFMESTHREKLSGQWINVLNPAEEFIALCLHHYKHMNSIYLLLDEGVHMNLLCDIYEYLKRNRIDPKQLRAYSERWQALPYVYFCVYYADALFAGSVLRPYVDAFRSDGGLAILDCIGLNDAERRIPSSSFWDRLFCEDMKALLAQDLSANDWDKLKINNQYMKHQAANPLERKTEWRQQIN